MKIFIPLVRILFKKMSKIRSELILMKFISYSSALVDLEKLFEDYSTAAN